MALTFRVYDGIRVCACWVRDSHPFKEINKIFILLAVKKMVKITAKNYSQI